MVSPTHLCWRYHSLPLGQQSVFERVPRSNRSKIIIIGLDNGLAPGRRQAIIWTNAGTLLIWPLGTNFSEILIEIDIFSFKKMLFKMSSGKWRPFCLCLIVLTGIHVILLFPVFQAHMARCVWKISRRRRSVSLADPRVSRRASPSRSRRCSVNGSGSALTLQVRVQR